MPLALCWLFPLDRSLCLPLIRRLGRHHDHPLWRRTAEAGFSSTSSKGEDSIQETTVSSSLESPTQASLPETPTSVSAASTKSGSDNDHMRTSALQSVARTLAPSDKRPSISSIGNATAAAKKWGWGVLSRNNEQKSTVEGVTGTEEQVLGASSGRGRPLPPPGTPLLRQRDLALRLLPSTYPRGSPSSTKVPSAARTLQEDRFRSSSSSQENQGPAATAAVGDEGLFVVEAPPESEPTSP
jgi:hypothetical protein